MKSGVLMGSSQLDFRDWSLSIPLSKFASQAEQRTHQSCLADIGIILSGLTV